MFNEADWSAFLSEELKATVLVRFGRARQKVLEAKYRSRARGAPSILDLRLSGFFGGAPEDVRVAVAHWLRAGKRARKSAALLDGWIADEVEKLPPATRRETPHEPRGNVHHLTPLFEALAASPEFLPSLSTRPALTWGRRTGMRARRSLQLGCYVTESDLIRVHPVLDQGWVPEWFVSYVLFHELLHAAVPTERGVRGRTIHHGPEFKRWEASYPDYRRAIEWLEGNLPRLMRSTVQLASAGPNPALPANARRRSPYSPAETKIPAAPPGWLFAP